MLISGYIKNSLIDYPGKITGIIFTQGCNFRCPFCHNPSLVKMKSEAPYIAENKVLAHLKTRKGLIDGVTITGGEPTLQTDLTEFIKKIRKLGFLIKLDTNGSNPEILAEMYTQRLLDYVAMDIKTTAGKYEKVTGYKRVDNIMESIKIIMNSGVDYEFRTTVLPALHDVDDFHEMGKMIENSNNYFIQNFQPEITLNPNFKKERSYKITDLEKIKRIMEKYVKNCYIRENA